MNVKHTLIAVAALAAIGFATPKAGAKSTIALGYANQETFAEWGTQRAESYDVAIALTDPSLVGKTIKGVEIPVVEAEGNINWSTWITTKLKLKSQDGKRVNNPNVCSMDVTPVDGYIRVDFENPYTITEDGAYVGYSFSATNSTDECFKPLKCVKGYTPEGMYIRTSNAFTTWENRGEIIGYTLAMRVILEDDFPETAVDLDDFFYSDSSLDGTPKAWVRLKNSCGRKIESIDYNYTVGDKSGTAHLDLENPIAAQWGRRMELHLPLCDMPKGIYDATVEITKVNGKENAAVNKMASNKLAVHNSLPVKRPVIEEYTGTWCGWCPRGFVAMEMMRERHPESVLITYHGGDPMQMATGNPAMASGYPRAFIDRAIECDPYTGTSSKPFYIENDWLKRCEEFAPLALNVKADFDGSNSIKATASMEWVRMPEDSNPANYRLEFVLLHDKMTGNSNEWAQNNYYSNDPSQFAADKNLADFVNGKYRVFGLEYNDVAIMNTGGFGIEESIVGIEPEIESDYTYTFDISRAYNSERSYMIQDRTKLRVAVLLLYVGNNSKGEIVNAAKCELPGYNSVENILSASEAVAVEWHDLQGRRIAAPARGIAIKTTRYADGSAHSEKILITE